MIRVMGYKSSNKTGNQTPLKYKEVTNKLNVYEGWDIRIISK